MTIGFFRECINPECKFRYPDTNVRFETAYCPICGEKALITKNVGSSIHSTFDIHGCAEIVPMLDNLRSIYNVGSIIRTCEGFGIKEIILSGITPLPTHPRMNKTGLGSIPSINWQSVKNGVVKIQELRSSGFQIITLESTENAVCILSVRKSLLQRQICLVVGNENLGIDPGILEISDLVLSIPMAGEKESFNVSVAFGIAAYQLTIASSA